MTDGTGKSGSNPAKNASNTNGATTFPHQQYLEKRDGQPYLPLKWRLAWLRSDHPQAKIITKLTSHEGQVAVFMAEVQLPEGATATGWGAKSRQEHPAGPFDSEGLDYLIAAENQALSRALAALGYGTEYALDFDPPAENQPIPLPEGVTYSPAPEEDEPGIVVPMEEPTPIRRPSPPVQEDEPEEDIEEEDDDEEEDEEVDFPGKPLPVTPPKGEVRSLFEKRPGPVTNISQVRETSERRLGRTPEPPGEEPAPAPVPLANRVAPPVEAVAGPTPGNPVVDERIKNVRDEGLRVKIKMIYQIARQKFSYDEDRVDSRSVQLYKKQTFELDSDQADDYYERIVTAPIPKRR